MTSASAERGAGGVGAHDALPRAAGEQAIAWLAALERDPDLARRALGIDLHEARVDKVGESRDRAATILVIADARDEPRPTTGLREMPGDVGRRAAELLGDRRAGCDRREPIPQQLAPNDDGGVAHELGPDRQAVDIGLVRVNNTLNDERPRIGVRRLARVIDRLVSAHDGLRLLEGGCSRPRGGVPSHVSSTAVRWRLRHRGRARARRRVLEPAALHARRPRVPRDAHGR